MKRGLETLIRLREAERNAKALACARARALLDEAAGRRERAERKVAAAQRALRAAAADGRAAGWWHPAKFGLVALAESAEREQAEELAAARAFAQAEGEARAAERALRALERLLERLAARERRARERGAQRRLEDVASAARRATLGAALLLASALCGAPARAQQPDAAVIPLLTELQARHAELDRRERALADRERHARELEKVAGARLEQAETIAAAVEQRIEGWKAEQGDKSISRLARIYGGMPPAKAAPLLGQLDLDLATRIVAKMKPGQSAALLPFLPAERALAMSWLVAHPLALRTGGDPAAAEPKR
jgi:flagellar motility protein MotE (MotC chaperone)